MPKAAVPSNLSPYSHSAQSHGSPLSEARQRCQLRDCRALVAAMALAALPISQVQAGLFGDEPFFEASQTVTISGEYLINNSFDYAPISDNYTGNSTGASEYDFSSVNGIEEGSASWSNSLDAQGFIRSESELSIKHEFGFGDDFFDLKVDVTNSVSYFDFIKIKDVAPPGSPNAAPINDPYIIRFQTYLTGDLSSTVNYGNPTDDGAGKAIYDTYLEYSGRIASTNGDADTPFDIGDTLSEHIAEPFIFGDNVDESYKVAVDVFFEDRSLYLWEGVFFGFDYTDTFSVDIEDIDAGSIDIMMSNDLGSTVITTASIYDIDGNLMPDLRAYSDAFNYQLAPNQGAAPVPVPATLALFGLGFAGLGWSRRKRA